MIDCHAHAYPPLSESLRRIAPTATGFALKAHDRLKDRVGALPFISAITRRVSSAMDAATLDVEKVAELRRRSARVKQLEPVLSLAALPQIAAAGSIARLYESMKMNGIEKTVLIAAEPIATNEWVLERARESEGRLVPVVNVPALRNDATEAEWYDAFVALAESGARGFKIHYNLDDLGADHAAYRILFEVAQRQRLFVIIHTGCFHVLGYKRPEPAEPHLFDALFSDFPDVRVCLAHMNRDEPEKAWAAMRRFESVWADTSWQPRDAVKRAVNEVGTERLLLGSDWPLLHPGLQADVIRVLRDALGDATAERIGSANARTFLKG